jgi:hypothetical protein
MSAHTVAKVIKTEHFVDHIKQMQERLFAIAPDALASFHEQVKRDGRLAYVFERPPNHPDKRGFGAIFECGDADGIGG